jgi:hypothetical protein
MGSANANSTQVTTLSRTKHWKNYARTLCVVRLSSTSTLRTSVTKPTEQDVQKLTSTADVYYIPGKMQTVLVNERVRPTRSFTNTKSI